MSAPKAEPSDERLAQDASAGNDEAFAALVARHKHRVFRIAARFTRSHAELDDLCQEIFIRVHRHLGKFRGDAPFEHWLSRVAVRTCYDHLRRSSRDRHAVALDGLDMPTTSGNFAPQHARELVEFALSKLSPEERLVITLLELEEYSVREIAALTGWSEANVKVRAFRARQAMKKILESAHER
ncbi:MAG: RNA polymerase sigma factor [Verrucomicrobiae bacterium]|nr:RNA polymerase sigma factor [Verrucomicrobiae bacterium]